jgi:hypothetical protein
MADDTDVLLKVYEEQWAQARQHENQRIAITNIILVIAPAITVFISQQGLNQQVLPLTILLIAIGLFGVLACSKLSEAADFHLERTRFLHKRLDELHPNAQLQRLRDEADKKHTAQFPRYQKIRVYQLWLILHWTIVLVGAVLTTIIIWQTR